MRAVGGGTQLSRMGDVGVGRGPLSLCYGKEGSAVVWDPTTPLYNKGCDCVFPRGPPLVYRDPLLPRLLRRVTATLCERKMGEWDREAVAFDAF